MYYIFKYVEFDENIYLVRKIKIIFELNKPYHKIIIRQFRIFNT